MLKIAELRLKYALVIYAPLTMTKSEKSWVRIPPKAKFQFFNGFKKAKNISKFNISLYKLIFTDLYTLIRVPHFAENQKSNPGTSFSHLFYLANNENPKKVEKSYHLGVPRYPPLFMY